MRCARIFCVEGAKILTSKKLGQGLEHLQVQVVRSAQQSVRHLFKTKYSFLSEPNPRGPQSAMEICRSYEGTSTCTVQVQ